MRKVCWVILAAVLCVAPAIHSMAAEATRDGGGQNIVQEGAAQGPARGAAQTAGPKAAQSAGQNATNAASGAAAKAADTTPTMHTHLKIAPDGTITVTKIFTNYPKMWNFYFRNTYTSRAPFSGDNSVPELVGMSVDGKKSSSGLVNPETDPYIQMYADTPGLHKYVLVYKERKRILFEEDYDRLVFGAWGGPDAEKFTTKVLFTIELPKGGVFHEFKARFGYETGESKAVKTAKTSKGWALLMGVEPMQQDEDFVVDVTWNKGVVTPDNSAEIIADFNMYTGIGFAVVFLVCLGIWWLFGRDPRPAAPIPLFYPPVFRGQLLAPGAMGYIWSAAELTSKGFGSILLNLAAQKAVTMFGAGTRKAPYAIVDSGKRPTTEVPKGDDSRTLWEKLISDGEGFDTAERKVLRYLFPTSKNPSADVVPEIPGVSPEELAPLKGHQCMLIRGSHSWRLAQARDIAYMELAGSLRSLWNLRTPVVSTMFGFAYICMAAVLGLMYLKYSVGAAWAVALAAMSIMAGLTFVIFKIIMRMHRMWMMWKEMGWTNLILYVVYIVFVLIFLLYDCFISNISRVLLFEALFDSWQAVRVLGVFVLVGYLLWLTRSFWTVFVTPLIALGFFLVLLLPAGMMWAMDMPRTVGILFLFAGLLVPLAFMPIMKQPTKECAKVLAAIRGYGMYLGTAETPMLNTLNPPDRTPEEFMRGLPYAVALGMEEAWGAKFADVVNTAHVRGGMLRGMAQYQHRMGGA